MQESCLIANNIVKIEKKKKIVNDVSIHIKSGEVVGLLGPNGAGKTTCFYVISGLIKMNYGSIFLDNIDITNHPMYLRARLGISYLPQDSSVFKGLSVEDNIKAVLEIIEPSNDKRCLILDQLLNDFSLNNLRRSPAFSLSGGERRRVEIARILAMKPRFILLDEPLAGIDPIAINAIKILIHGLREKGIGVLITDHNVRATFDIIDRAYIMYDGKVITQGTVEEISNDDQVQRLYLGKDFNY